MDRFGALIIGGGILGVLTAAAAAGAGLRPLVLRLSDRVRPQAETLRNQGWLQSGVMNRLRDFPSTEDFADFGYQVYTFGRQMLRECGLPLPPGGGIIYSSDPKRIAELNEARALLRIPSNGFRQLELDEAKAIIGEGWQADKTYFQIPDGPFDEAAVLEHYRRVAKAEGAAFLELDQPATLERVQGGIRVHFDGFHIDAPRVVVAAGAGSFELMKQAGEPVNGKLSCTPLLVADAPASMPAPLLVDLDKGFSAIRHHRADDPPAVVIGTRVKLSDEGVAKAPDRKIDEAHQREFRASLPAPFTDLEGRFTAGVEVVPARQPGSSPFRPWVEGRGDIIFASPGRATIAQLAATKVLERLIALRGRDRRETSPLDISACREWDAPISMHYMATYHFNDAEVGT